MLVGEKHYRSIWLDEEDPAIVKIIDQRFLPHQFIIEEIRSFQEAAKAIREMHARGAPLIGALAAYGLYLAAIKGEDIYKAKSILANTRPTAVNLFWALDTAIEKLAKSGLKPEDCLREFAEELCERDVQTNKSIGENGLQLIQDLYNQNQKPINILTHCNAGWLATVDWGTATSAIYHAQHANIPIHVWVDETRPRNQGARLTAWELQNAGVEHSLIVDNAGGHLMQKGEVDMVIVGTDRTSLNGFVANKIGTYLKALAAKANNVPFYVALPSSTIDWREMEIDDFEIENRSGDEVKWIWGKSEKGENLRVLLSPEESKSLNPAFDVCPPELITGLITERGICAANKEALLKLFPENG